MSIHFRAGLLCLLLFELLILNCNKEEYASRDFPRLITREASNFTDEEVSFNAEILVRGNHEIHRYGFVWSKRSRPRLEDADAEKIIKNGAPEKNRFSIAVPSHLLQDSLVFCRAFLVSSQYTIYGSDITVYIKRRLGEPLIQGFFPKSGYCGDTLFIRGSKFSHIKENNIVKIGNTNCEVAEASDTLLSVVLPHGGGSGLGITVTINGMSVNAIESFNYIQPVLERISPSLGTFGDTITLSGFKFIPGNENNLVRFGSIRSNILSASRNEIKVTVPAGLDYYEVPVVVSSGCYDLTTIAPFRLTAPVIHSFHPDTVSRPGRRISILGKYFSPAFGINEVFVDGIKCSLLDYNQDSIGATIPFELFPNINVTVSKEAEVRVVVAGQTVIAALPLKLKWESAWTKMKDFPGTSRSHAVAFALNSKGYFGCGYSISKHMLLNDFWEYNPTSDHWRRVADFPGLPRMDATAFEFNSSGYVGLGTSNGGFIPGLTTTVDYYRDFYRYDPQLDQWIAIPDFKGASRHSAAAMLLNNEPYVGLGVLEMNASQDEVIDFWKFNPHLNDWFRTPDFPVHARWATGFNPSNFSFIFHSSNIYRFDGQAWHAWIPFNHPHLYPSCFVLSTNLYIGFGLGPFSDGTSQFFEVSSLTGNKKEMGPGTGNQRWGSAGFVIENKAYILGGLTGNSAGLFDLNDVWKFDPSRIQ